MSGALARVPAATWRGVRWRQSTAAGASGTRSMRILITWGGGLKRAQACSLKNGEMYIGELAAQKVCL